MPLFGTFLEPLGSRPHQPQRRGSACISFQPCIPGICSLHRRHHATGHPCPHHRTTDSVSQESVQMSPSTVMLKSSLGQPAWPYTSPPDRRAGQGWNQEVLPALMVPKPRLGQTLQFSFAPQENVFPVVLFSVSLSAITQLQNTPIYPCSGSPFQSKEAERGRMGQERTWWSDMSCNPEGSIQISLGQDCSSIWVPQRSESLCASDI